MRKLPCGHEPEAILGVQYRGTQHDHDGISEWKCVECGRRWGRWTNKEMKDGEFEERYGGPHPKPSE